MRALDRDESGRITTQGRVERLEMALQFILLAVLGLGLIVLLSGCNLSDPHARWGWNTPDEGMIHGRDYTPAHFNYGTSCSTVGTSQICTPTQTYVPDSWSLDLYAEDGDHGWNGIAGWEYERCQVGQRYPDCAK